MDLKFTDFESFKNSVEKVTGRALEEAKKILKYKGKEIYSIDDIFIGDDGELFDILPDGSLIKVNLYIASQVYQWSNLVNIKELYKYHIYQCSTIRKMFDSGRSHRYYINSRDDGTFVFSFINLRGVVLKKNENQKLNICKNCLGKLYHKRHCTDDDVENFGLKGFDYNGNLFGFDTSSIEKGERATHNVYVNNWNAISKKIKIHRNYTCENCGYKPKSKYDEKFIHTHHINGDKRDNRPESLNVLCIKCHSEVDAFHGQVKRNPAYAEFINMQSEGQS